MGMNDKPRAEASSKVDEHFDPSALIRLGLWGGGAVLAVTAAIFAANAHLATRQASAPPAPVAKPAPERTTAAQLIARANEPDAEVKRLEEAVRLLSVDRDRLATRVSAIERSIDDLTGSIARIPRAAPPREPASDSPLREPPPAAGGALPSPTATTAPPMARPVVSAWPPPDPPPVITAAPMTAPPPSARADIPVPRPSRLATIESYVRSTPEPADHGQFGRAEVDDQSAAGSVATATDFGVDLGGATSVNGLRALWASLRGKYAQHLNGLWPVMSIKDRVKPGTIELRLIAGPLPNAGQAARLCATFAGLGIVCQPAVFDGQRLALH
jgi:hypothetical protein